MKRVQQQNRRGYLVDVLCPAFCRKLSGEDVVNLTGMVWSGGISAAAIPRFQTYR